MLTFLKDRLTIYYIGDNGDKKYFVLGRINKALEPVLKSLGTVDFYLCGGRQVVESLKNYLLDFGVPSENLFFEKF